MLQRGDDLETLARDAVRAVPTRLGMAGGDGSQAIVAGVAMEHDLPFVCIPAGTRNHLALDLGVDRDDVVGSLEAFIDGYERRIDLGLVNGRVFVNNVSLGVYAEIVQSDAYRDQKLKTAGDMLPELFGPGSETFDFDLESADGPIDDACMVLVSNNVYELERLAGFGTGYASTRACSVSSRSRYGMRATSRSSSRSKLAGRVGSFSGWHHWSVPVLEVRSSRRDRGRSRRRSAPAACAAAVRDRARRAPRPRGAVGARCLAGPRRARAAHRRSHEAVARRVRSLVGLTPTRGGYAAVSAVRTARPRNSMSRSSRTTMIASTITSAGVGASITTRIASATPITTTRSGFL